MSTHLKIALVGTGQVAQHFAQRFTEQGINLHCIWGRQIQHIQEFANSLNTYATQSLTDLYHANIIIIAIKDSAIAQFMEQLSPYLSASCLVVHTSGSTDIQILQQYHHHVGVLYPLQTFSLGRQINWQTTPLLLETALIEDKTRLYEIAQQLSPRLYDYSSAQRLALHLSAVIACNFSNLCYDIAQQLMDHQGVDFSLLHPLILETAHKATLHLPVSVQTGPAKRQDMLILQQHQQFLSHIQHDDWANFYALMSQLIIQRHST